MADAVYRRVWAVRAARAPFAGSCAARLSFAVLPLALILLVRDATGSFGAAGLVSGALSATLTVCAPARARLLDRVGARRGLVRLAVPYLAGLGALVVLAERGAGTLAPAGTAAVAGVFGPPLGPAMRVLWAGLLRRRGPLLRTAYSLDAVVEEVVFTAGPLLAAALVAVGGLAWAMAAVMVLIGAGTAGFVLSPAAREKAPGAGGAKGRTPPLALAGMRTLVLAFGGVGLAVGVLGVVLPYVAEEAGAAEAGGILLALLSAGSVLGGLWYGRRSWRTPLVTRFTVLLAAFSLTLPPLALTSRPVAVGALVLLLGSALAPLFTSGYLLVAELTATTTASPTEANTWVSTANNGGAAAGAALAGILLGPCGPAGTLAFACAATAALAAAASLRRGSLREPSGERLAGDP